MFSSIYGAIFGTSQEQPDALDHKIEEQELDIIIDNSREPPRRYLKVEWLGKGGFATCYRVIEVTPDKR